MLKEITLSFSYLFCFRRAKSGCSLTLIKNSVEILIRFLSFSLRMAGEINYVQFIEHKLWVLSLYDKGAKQNFALKTRV